MCGNNADMGNPPERSALLTSGIPPEPLPNVPDSNDEVVSSEQQVRGGWTKILVIAGVVTTFGSSLPVGYNIGVINTPAEIIKAFCNASVTSRYGTTLTTTSMDILWSSIVSIFIVGGVTGSALGASLADRFGRKGAVVIVNGLSLIGSALFLLCRSANSIEMLLLGRLVVGLAGGLTTSTVPMYLAELAPPNLTGAMGAICPMGINFGVLLGQVIGLPAILGGPNDWPYLLAAFGLLVAVFFPLLILLPESPKYLYVIKGDNEKAIRALTRVYGVSSSNLSDEISLLHMEAAANTADSAGDDNRWGLMKVLQEPSLRLPLALACSMQAGQQTSGINAVFYYSSSIFTKAGLSKTAAQYATIGTGFINCVTAVVMLYLMIHCGRRKLLLGSTGVAAATLLTLAVAIKLSETVTWMAYICIAAVLVYVLVYGFGLGPIPYFIASELFEVGPRPAAMGWGSLSNWAGNFLVGMSFPSMQTAIGSYSFLIFASITAALFVFQYLYLPETKGKTPTEINAIFNKKEQLLTEARRKEPKIDQL